MAKDINLIHRKINFDKDKEYVLEKHCIINYECDSPLARKVPYVNYRSDWFSMKEQIAEFYEYMKTTATDARTIAEIIEDENGNVLGYLWVPFYEIRESGFCFAEIKDLYIEEQYRSLGIATMLLTYAEQKAIENKAAVIRSGTGGENVKSINLHNKLGYSCTRYEFEKVLP